MITSEHCHRGECEKCGQRTVHVIGDGYRHGVSLGVTWVRVPCECNCHAENRDAWKVMSGSHLGQSLEIYHEFLDQYDAEIKENAEEGTSFAEN